MSNNNYMVYMHQKQHDFGIFCIYIKYFEYYKSLNKLIKFNCFYLIMITWIYLSNY